MAKPPFPVKYRVKNFEWILGLGISAPIFVIQFVLSLTGVLEIVSEILGLIQIAIQTYFYWRTKINTKNAAKRLASYLATDFLDEFPWVNDIPFTPFELWYLRKLSREDDVEAAEKQAMETAAVEAQRQAEYDAFIERRLATQAANDNYPMPRAANDNFDDGFEYAEAA